MKLSKYAGGVAVLGLTSLVGCGVEDPALGGEAAASAIVTVAQAEELIEPPAAPWQCGSNPVLAAPAACYHPPYNNGATYCCDTPSGSTSMWYYPSYNYWFSISGSCQFWFDYPNCGYP